MLRLTALSESPDAFGSTYEQARSLTADAYDEFASSRSESDTDALFIAIDQDEPLGMIGAFFEKTTGRPFISSMWVRPDLRRCGIGRELFLLARDWLLQAGATEVHAWVVCDNDRARPFYQSLGFAGTSEFDQLPSNPELREQLYRLPLRTD